MTKHFDKGGAEWEMYADYYRLSQTYWIPEPASETYWANLVEGACAFMRKYEQIPLARRLALALLDSLEERARAEGLKSPSFGAQA